ncbi:MAG: DUF1800 domain-containing protein [Gemmatimonadaceae bacterium]
MLSRRGFLGTGTAIAAGTALGCDSVPEALQRLAGSGDAFVSPDADDIDDVRHALNRLTFGARPQDYARLAALGPTPAEALQRFITEQLDYAQIDDGKLAYALSRYDYLDDSAGELYEYKPELLRAALASATLLRAVYSERQLYEVMVHFWTDHFNIDISKGDCRWLKAADDRIVIRTNALGTFRALVRASATSAAMLWYLDGRVNRRANAEEKPNENYARELLELHTLGVDGGYTQRDVMEVARALTGWTVRSTGESRFRIGSVEFHAELHDDGPKTILGHEIAAGRGADDLDAVVDIVVRHPSTARFVATKLCRRFIADDPPVAAVNSVADTFAGMNGSVMHTLRTLFGRDEFRAARGSKLKRPFHFVTSALRATDARSDAGAALQDFLLRMGHVPFEYPTPDGYPDEATPWLGTLLWRWSFAAALSANEIAGTSVDSATLVARSGSHEKLMAHCLGRSPSPNEIATYNESGAGLALLLASPAFQRY